MKILDLYILRRFLVILAATILAFSVIVLVVNFIERGLRMFDRYDPPLYVMGLYYLNYMPFYIILAFPVAMLVSTLFSLGALAKNHELDVMKASGLSLYRITAPILIAAFFFSIGVMLFGEFVLTKTERRKDEIQHHLIEKRPLLSRQTRADIKVPGENGWIILGKTYDIPTAIATTVRVHHILENRIIKSYAAEKMVRSDSGWILLNGTGQEFPTDSITVLSGGFTRFDTLWAPFLTQSPEMLSEMPLPPRQVGFFMLLDRIRQEREIGEPVHRDMVELYLRITFPFANFILVLLGAPLAANPRRSGPSVGFGIALIVSFIFFVLLRVGESFGKGGKLPPLLAASLGDLVFIIVGAVLMYKARK